MDPVKIIAGLTFLVVVTVLIGIWWVSAQRRRIRERLGYGDQASPKTDTRLLRESPQVPGLGWLGPLWRRLAVLTEQAGYKGETSDLLLAMGTLAVLGGGAAWLRTGGILSGMLVALIAGSLPICRLLYKRSRRLRVFERQFPDALDMLTRSIRAGYALSQAVHVVGEEMPDPTGQEFRRVGEELRAGLEPGEALSRLLRRAPTDDVGFFCAAVNIQRSAGGNLAEILDGLSEVIRERFKILSHARALSAQARWTAIIVGLAPLLFAILFKLLQPDFFDPLLASPLAPLLIMAGIISQAIGFLFVWRIANIKV